MGPEEEDDSLDLSLLSEGSGSDDDGAATAPRAAAAAPAGRKRTAHAAGLNDAPPASAAAQQQDDDTQLGDEAAHRPKPSKRKRVLREQRLKRLHEQHAARGIVYMSRIPPHMKPAKIRQLLGQHGEVGRIFCTPEDPKLRQQRKRHGGNTGKNFTEGWIEFEDKRVAKQVAAALNGTAIGGRKRSAYHFDLWNLKYLPKFKWDHLTQEIAYEKAVREQRLAAELSAAKRERDFYLGQVDRAKAAAAIKQRREARGGGGGGGNDGGAAAAAAAGSSPPPDAAPGGGAAEAAAAAAAAAGAAAAAAPGAKGPRVLRHFGQRQAKPKDVSSSHAVLPDQLLALVAGK